MKMVKIEELKEGQTKIKNRRDLRQSTDCKINQNLKNLKLSMNQSKLRNMHRRIKTKKKIKINKRTKNNQNIINKAILQLFKKKNLLIVSAFRSLMIARKNKKLNLMSQNKKIMRNKSGIKRKEIKRKTLKSKKKTLKRKTKILRNRIKKSQRSKVVSLVIVSVS